MQGLGLLLCVALSYSNEGDGDIQALLPNSPLVHITTGCISDWSQRQLADQVPFGCCSRADA